jgi:hypothetical protein
MKYYIEITVRHEDPLTHYTGEDFIDLNYPWVDVESSQMNDEWAKARLISEYWEDFDPATPAPRMWWETDSGKDENNDYYTLVVYTATDDGEPDFDNMVAGASMDTCDIWEEKERNEKKQV